MKAGDAASSIPVERRALFILLVLVTVALASILVPIYGAVMWGAIIAMLFSPVYRWLLPRLWRRPNCAAVVTLLIALVMVILPLAFIAASLASEAALLYVRLQSGELNPARYLHGVFDALPRWVTSLLDRFGLANFDVLQRRLTASLAQGSQFVATRVFSFGQDTFEFVVSLFITLYLAFFLIRDGDSVVQAVRQAIPLAGGHKRALFETFTTVIRATVKGNLLVAAIQGALGGLAFWVLGLSASVLWAVLMAVLSLMPAIGSALVWAPVAIYFIFTGALWKGFAMLAYGVLVIGLIDNLLRPALVGKDTRLPDYVVMVTTVGGIAIFGINGFVLGPAIAAMFMAVLHIYGCAQAQMQANAEA